MRAVYRAEQHVELGAAHFGELRARADRFPRTFGKFFAALFHRLFDLFLVQLVRMRGLPRKAEIGRRLVAVEQTGLVSVIGRGLGDGRGERLRMVHGARVPFRVTLVRRPVNDDGAVIRLAAHRTAVQPLYEKRVFVRRAREHVHRGGVRVGILAEPVLARKQIQPPHVEPIVQLEEGRRLFDELARHVPGKQRVQRAHLLHRLFPDLIRMGDSLFILRLPRFEHLFDLRAQKDDEHDGDGKADAADKKVQPVRVAREIEGEKHDRRDQRRDEEKDDEPAQDFGGVEPFFGMLRLHARGVVLRNGRGVLLRVHARTPDKLVKIRRGVLFDRGAERAPVIF